MYLLYTGLINRLPVHVSGRRFNTQLSCITKGCLYDMCLFTHRSLTIILKGHYYTKSSPLANGLMHTLTYPNPSSLLNPE